MRDLCKDSLDKIIAEAGDFFLVLTNAGESTFAGLSKSHNTCYIFRSRPDRGLLTSTVDNRLKLPSAADVKSSDSLWTVNLVGRDREHVDIYNLYIDRDLANRLYRVGVEQRAIFMRYG